LTWAYRAKRCFFGACYRDPEDRRGLTALFWSDINPYGTFRLDMDKQLDLGLPVGVPRPRSAEATAATAR
jgi:hypothetical protein